MATTIQQEFARHRLQKDWLSCDASLEPLFQRILSEDGTHAPCVTNRLSYFVIHTSTYSSLAARSSIWQRVESIITSMSIPMLRQWHLLMPS